MQASILLANRRAMASPALATPAGRLLKGQLRLAAKEEVTKGKFITSEPESSHQTTLCLSNWNPKEYSDKS